MNPSRHFSVKELDCDCGCGTGTMDPEFISLLDSLRDSFGGPLSLTSAYRCVKRNAEQGGAKASQHLLGRAADIYWSNMSGADRQKLLSLALPLFRGIGFHPLFLHVDNRTGPEAVFFYPA